jgi:hypothetical protein
MEGWGAGVALHTSLATSATSAARATAAARRAASIRSERVLVEASTTSTPGSGTDRDPRFGAAGAATDWAFVAALADFVAFGEAVVVPDVVVPDVVVLVATAARLATGLDVADFFGAVFGAVFEAVFEAVFGAGFEVLRPRVAERAGVRGIGVLTAAGKTPSGPDGANWLRGHPFG